VALECRSVYRFLAMLPEPSPAHSMPASSAPLVDLPSVLKRCSAETLAAACEFRRTRDVAQLDPIVRGVIARYVESELRPKLAGDARHVRLVEDLALDSLSMMEIVVLAEDVLGISVSNEELIGLQTVSDLSDFVANKVRTGC